MNAQPATLKPTTLQWIALALLVISVGINYADRGNLAVAATRIETELHFDPRLLGILGTGFFWTYSLSQLFAGKVIDRWNVNWVYAIAFLIWSGATALTGFVSSFALLFTLRLLLGFGESVAYPSYSKIIANFFPEQLRGTANALIDAGSKIGPAVGILVGVEMVSRLSWRGMFILLGGVSLIWLLPWCVVAAKLPAQPLKKAAERAPAWTEIVSKRRFWGTAIGLFGGNYAWYFYLTWLPYYFERERHYEKNQLAIMASLPFWAVAIASMLFGLLADALIRRGRDPGRVRQTFVAVGLLGCGLFMLAAVLVPAALWADILLILASISMGGFSSNHWALTQRLSGPEAAGKWTGIQNCLGNFAGITAPWVTGSVLAATHSFFAAFAIACAVLIGGALSYRFIIGPPEHIVWRTASSLPGNHRDPEGRPMHVHL